MAQSIDIRRNEKLIFSHNVETYKFDVSADGSTVTATFNLTDPIPQPEVGGGDIGEIHARLQAEAAAESAETADETEADETAEPEAADDAEPAKKRSSRASR